MTGMPIGVVNMAIVDAAARGAQRLAIGIGIGGALADSVHAGLAFVGVGRVVAAHPRLTQAMAIGAAVIILGYVVAGARRPIRAARQASTGVATGLLVTLPNPAALAAWVAVAAATWPAIEVGPALALAAGVGVGSAAWFVLLARFISKLPRDGWVARAVPRVALGLLVAIALAGVVRAFA